MSILEVRDLTKIYPAFRLDGISFSLEAGKITGFIGRNGAGKSTTLASLFNFVHPDGGEVSFFGMPFSGNEAEIKRRTGFVSGGVDFYLKKDSIRYPRSRKAFIPVGTMPHTAVIWGCSLSTVAKRPQNFRRA